MVEEVFHIKGGLPFNNGENNLTDLINRILKDVPANAEGLSVIIYSDGLHDISHAVLLTSRGFLPVEFRPAFSPHKPNTAAVGYGVGNQE